MEIQGKIVAVLPQRNGKSKTTGNAWSCASYVLETQEMHPKRMAFDVMNDNITQFNIQQGEYLKVSFDINAREYNGKWYNSVRVWAVQRTDMGQMGQQPQSAFQQQPQAQPAAGTQKKDDLPF